MEEIDDLVKAWIIWDRNPGSYETARALIEADAKFGSTIGMPGHKLRDGLATLRRTGLDYHLCIQRVVLDDN